MRKWILSTWEIVVKEVIKDAVKYGLALLYASLGGLGLGLWVKFRHLVVPVWLAVAIWVGLGTIQWLCTWLWLRRHPRNRMADGPGQVMPDEKGAIESPADDAQSPVAISDGDYMVPIEPFPPDVPQVPGGSYHSSDKEVSLLWEGVRWTTTASHRYVHFPDDGPRCPDDDCLLAAYEKVAAAKVVDAYWKCDVCGKRFPRLVEHPAKTLWRAYRVLESRWRNEWRHQIKEPGFPW